MTKSTTVISAGHIEHVSDKGMKYFDREVLCFDWAIILKYVLNKQVERVRVKFI